MLDLELATTATSLLLACAFRIVAVLSAAATGLCEAGFSARKERLSDQELISRFNFPLLVENLFAVSEQSC